ncbi:hypothetical protein JAAARDRAFT_280219 [Jaapia argillacea MUCL 33604]|uniref:BTB domain-containing protein n=1 Tax=Jaapia argillacea MUCL 33604 TaxID=933084 RepID=A0A067PT22_9AGAM|nr:hypothetical protein JAAARDRAFT_280219 [Jaapia argillacea MUCL 33604]
MLATPGDRNGGGSSYNYRPKSSPRTDARSPEQRNVYPAQILTPPDSEDPTRTVTVSTVFYPGSSVHPYPIDLILASSDGVFFYVHHRQLLHASLNSFNSLLSHSYPSRSPDENCPVVPLPDHSLVLNILLHVIYDIPFSQFSPSMENLSNAVEALKTYGLPLDRYISHPAPLYHHLLLVAPLDPLKIYTLAASHDLHELAVATSSHLLSFPLASLTDDDAMRIGPVYLKRLFFLHLGRIEALKRVILPPPHPHPPIQGCSFDDQKKLLRVWALAAAYLAWDCKPDLPISTIKATMEPLTNELNCQLCKSALQEKLKTLVAQWAGVKVGFLISSHGSPISGGCFGLTPSPADDLSPMISRRRSMSHQRLFGLSYRLPCYRSYLDSRSCTDVFPPGVFRLS